MRQIVNIYVKWEKQILWKRGSTHAIVMWECPNVNIKQVKITIRRSLHQDKAWLGFSFKMFPFVQLFNAEVFVFVCFSLSHSSDSIHVKTVFYFPGSSYCVFPTWKYFTFITSKYHPLGYFNRKHAKSISWEQSFTSREINEISPGVIFSQL